MKFVKLLYHFLLDLYHNNGHQMKIRYISIPLGYQMKTDDNTKLELVADMIDNIMDLMPE